MGTGSKCPLVRAIDQCYQSPYASAKTAVYDCAQAKQRAMLQAGRRVISDKFLRIGSGVNEMSEAQWTRGKRRVDEEIASIVARPDAFESGIRLLDRLVSDCIQYVFASCSI